MNFSNLFPISNKSLLFFVLILMLSLVYFKKDSGLTATPSHFSPKNPGIEFSHVPPYNSFENLKGRVLNADPDEYCVAVYIYVSGWWTKPYWIRPKTNIRKDRTWVCDVTTGGTDEKATKFAAFLIPKNYDPPLMYGEMQLPEEIYENSIAIVENARERK